MICFASVQPKLDCTPSGLNAESRFPLYWGKICANSRRQYLSLELISSINRTSDVVSSCTLAAPIMLWGSRMITYIFSCWEKLEFHTDMCYPGILPARIAFYSLKTSHWGRWQHISWNQDFGEAVFNCKMVHGGGVNVPSTSILFPAGVIPPSSPFVAVFNK